MRRTEPLLLVLAALPLIASCTHVPSADEPPPLQQRLADMGYRQGAEVRAVPRLAVDSWKYVDTRHIAIGLGSGHEPYLAEWANECYRLDNQDFVTTATTGGWLTPMDKIYAMQFGDLHHDCTFRQFYRLEPLQASVQ